MDYNEQVYCDEPCTTQTCRQLSAGCGISLFDMAGAANGGWRVGRRGQTDWGDERCDQASVEAGTCNLCKEPVWCDDSSDFGFNGSIATPEDWMTEFFDNDGGRAYGSRRWRGFSAHAHGATGYSCPQACFHLGNVSAELEDVRTFRRAQCPWY